MMVISKPLATRADGETQAHRASRVGRGVPLSRGVDGFTAHLLPDTARQGIPLERSGQALLNQHARQNAAMTALAQVMDSGGAALESVGSAGSALLNSFFQSTEVTRPTGLDKAETAIRVASNRHPGGTPQDAGAAAAPGAAGEGTERNLGALSSFFESGKDGMATIGYDRQGGTSYGTYQISSKTGSMERFIDFLRNEEPQWADRLENAGPANTGGRRGKMPETWKRIAEENPERFEQVQDRFIRQSHFAPAVNAIAAATGVAFDLMPPAVQEVLFSTAVQHGPSGAARIFSRAVAQIGPDALNPDTAKPESLQASGEKLIRRIYDIRSGQFGSSTPAVQSAVKSRLKQEMSVALSMLRSPNPSA